MCAHAGHRAHRPWQRDMTPGGAERAERSRWWPERRARRTPGAGSILALRVAGKLFQGDRRIEVHGEAKGTRTRRAPPGAVFRNRWVVAARESSKLRMGQRPQGRSLV